MQADAGIVRIRGKDAGSLSITGRRLLGAAFVPEERLGHGAAPRMKLSENLLLSRYATDRKAFVGAAGVVKTGAVDAAAQRIIEVMDVRKSARDPEAAALSGGNLQKFIIGRELDRRPSVMVVNQPTWGVDAGAAAKIRQSLIELARSRIGGAGHQPGPRRAVRDLRRDRRHAQWRVVEAAADRARRLSRRSAC